MYVDAEAKSGPVWVKANDDRTTPHWKMAQKTSLDEIPQFINVLRGDMSVVSQDLNAQSLSTILKNKSQATCYAIK